MEFSLLEISRYQLRNLKRQVLTIIPIFQMKKQVNWFNQGGLRSHLLACQLSYSGVLARAGYTVVASRPLIVRTWWKVFFFDVIYQGGHFWLLEVRRRPRLLPPVAQPSPNALASSSSWQKVKEHEGGTFISKKLFSRNGTHLSHSIGQYLVQRLLLL